MTKDHRKAQGRKAQLEVVGKQRKLALGEVLLDVRAELRELMFHGGMAVVGALFDEDLDQLCGKRYGRKDQEAGLGARWGHQRGQVVLGGRKVSLSRPRARRSGEELALPSYARLQLEDPLNDRMMEQMLIGVSTRNYRRSLEPVLGEFPESVVDKSSVSRRFIVRTKEQLKAALKKPLGGIEWAALYIDGINFAEHVVVIALGLDANGKKHLLGLREGSTENGTLCKEMLSDLVERGMPVDRALLIVIDGGKGLRKAVRDVFAQYGVVQRCQVHKTRNVLDQLPEVKKPSVRVALREAYNSETYETALKRLTNLARVLAKEHPGAASSLREGLEETLTVKRLGLTGALERSLRTTNPIENLNSGIRRISGRVKRWRSGEMVLRWAAASALDAEKRFHRLKGYKAIPLLLAALRNHDHQLAAAA